MEHRSTPDPSRLYTITTAAYLIRRGIAAEVRREWGSTFGRLAKRRFMETNGGRVPGTVNRYIGRTMRAVFAYREIDVPILDEVWNELAKRKGLNG